MSKENISKEEVKHIAKLCNLPLTEEEVTKYAELLTDTLGFINVLEELDTSEKERTYQVTGLTNVFMHGNNATLNHKAALSNAKEEIEGMFATSAVFER